MSLQFACPKCETPFKATPALIGKKVRCKKCQHIFVVKDTTRRDDADVDRPARDERVSSRRHAEEKVRPAGRARDDEYDKDDRPRQRKRSMKPAGLGGGMLGLIIGGGVGLFAVVGLLVAGLALGWFSSAKAPDNQNRAPIAHDPKPGPNANPNPRPNPNPNSKPSPGVAAMQPAAFRMELKTADGQFRRATFAREAKVVAIHTIDTSTTPVSFFLDRYDFVTGTHFGRCQPKGLTEFEDNMVLSTDAKLLAGMHFKTNGKVVTLWNTADGQVLFADWNPMPQSPFGQPGGFDSGLIDLWFLDGERLLTLSAGGRLAVWNVPDKQKVYEVRVIPANKLQSLQCDSLTKLPRDFAFSSDRKTLAVYHGDGFYLVDTATGQITRSTASIGLDRKVGNVYGTAFSPDGGALAFLYTQLSNVTSGRDLSKHDTLLVWDLKTEGKEAPQWLIQEKLTRDGKIQGQISPTTAGTFDGVWYPSTMSFWGSRQLVLFESRLRHAHLVDLDVGGNYLQSLFVDRTTARMLPESPDGRLWIISSIKEGGASRLMSFDPPVAELKRPAPRNPGATVGWYFLTPDGILRDFRP